MRDEYLDNLVHTYGTRVFAKFNAPPDIDTVYIGRGSLFGNPFKTAANKTEQSRIDNCLKFREYLNRKIKILPDFALAVSKLHNKTVVCYCSNGTTSVETGARYCHGHILLSAAHHLNNR